MNAVLMMGVAPKVGKTYASVLLLRELMRQGANPAYFKFAQINASSIEESDAALVKQSCNLNQEISEMLPYIFPQNAPVYLASREQRNFIDTSVISQRFAWNLATHSHMVVEGCGEVITPMVMEQGRVIMQDDLIRKLRLNTVLVAKVNPSTLNLLSLSVHYLRSVNLAPKGIILNGYDERSYHHRDTYMMVERFCQTPVIATIAANENALHLRSNILDIFTSDINYEEQVEY